jgi:CHAT domain-containing protein
MYFIQARTAIVTRSLDLPQDIAGLDLRSNQLTVLSACDTARGDIKIGEGVFGLRRAFAIAGTKTLIMSLWKVPDRATALLMERFFDNYRDGMEPVEALQNAQDYIRNIAIAQLRESEEGNGNFNRIGKSTRITNSKRK